ncbi:hypothetical protein SAMN04488021_12056 [Paracoccus aminovorans]|uniref:Argininosuccinate lyase n=1 Tax=Paracoccus aminovorans TaxID=34004 RepID=A0A1I3B9Z3_9RHOB|nr:hypothetical protein [Paracoccus aminovorans]CQR85371.1 hypothetical protein JCM7685_0791 [Paracoccus aminovorans]SFH59094.1 hypothetical protein SAMN04488021_12056 [Paracoccus aminovorans]
MTHSLLLAALALMLATLAACGVDGAPTRPETPPPGLQVSGEARIGVVSKL